MEELSFIEIIIGQIALRLARLGIKDKEGIAITNINNENSMIKHVLNAMHFKLTEDQQSALDEIQNDQKSSKQMIRLLHGDVGSGKTIVAILAALGVVENGYQAFFLAPTAILAKQHHTTMQKVCFGLGLNIRLITGSTTAKERKTILSEIKLGQANIIIGTHALFNDKIEPHKVGLFIIDEQHNFGVQQRLSLINKCNNSDVLMMSATPIPRTVVMALYGDIKVSSIKTKPNGRQEIKTSVMNGQKIPTLVKDIEKRITENQDKVYWVCPLVEESEKKPYTNVNERYNFIKENINQEINIGLLHGKMKDSEKNQVMEEFKSSKTKVLVSTTVIEVGVDVPDANIIIIENAEKFGLAQLHQLRGRVGRGTKQSFCILLYGENLSLSGRQRLEIIKNNSDGFVIADYDFKMRGGGDIMGNEQSGFGSFKFASLTGNDSVIKECTEISRKIAQDTNNQTVKTIIELFNINSKYDMLST